MITSSFERSRIPNLSRITIEQFREKLVIVLKNDYRYETLQAPFTENIIRTKNLWS